MEPADIEPSRRAPARANADASSGATVPARNGRARRCPTASTGRSWWCAESSESSDPLTVPTLYMALDSKIGGTVEMADEGPFFNDDFRVAGDTRLIRARPGYRPIVRVERSSSEAVRKQPAVFVLDRQNLILDGIDLVVDVRDLYPEQTALFSCSGSTLTLRNCSITILNHNNTSFSVVRVEPDRSRPTRIRLERTLVRGGFAAGVDLAGGSTELALNKSVILGGPGPLVRVAALASARGTRFFFVDSILAGPGPIIELARSEPGTQTKPLSIRAFGSIFGRLHGVGVASVISSASSAAGAAKQIDWGGDHNLFAGWKGFFACGNDPLVTIPGLAEVRSTWNRADQESQEILLAVASSSDLAAVTPEELAPFVPNREKILWQVAQPRAGLFQKAVGEYPSPAIPSRRLGVRASGSVAERSRTGECRRPQPRAEGKSARAAVNASATRAEPSVSDPFELTFDTAAPPWEGDLGAFLRDRLTPGVKHVRVRVIGSGHHRFTPVRLPPGSLAGDSRRTLGRRRAPLVVTGAQRDRPGIDRARTAAPWFFPISFLRHEETSRLEHLIHVEDGHLVLSRCQFTAPGSSADFAGDLIAFRSPSTQPYPSRPQQAIILDSRGSPGLSPSRVGADHGRNRAEGRAGQGLGRSDRMRDRGRRSPASSCCRPRFRGDDSTRTW